MFECHSIINNLRQHVTTLAGEIGTRNVFNFKNLIKAKDYIKNQFLEMGYEVDSQPIAFQGEVCKNIIVQSKLNNKFNKIIVLGAHYDTVANTPGAGDNASGIAALIEISRLLKNRQLPYVLRFLAFVNEEPPFIRTSRMGSYHYASRCKRLNENIAAMYSLDSIGYFYNKNNTQRYRYLFPTWGFPTKGDFIAFIGDFRSTPIINNLVNHFKKYSSIKFKTLRGPAWMEGINSSDHWAFWQQNYPAVMITDTAPFRYSYYHTSEDTFDKLNYVKLATLTYDLARYFAYHPM